MPSASANLVFFDADAFDSGLSTSLADKPGEVHVAFASPTSLNTLPPRLNTWLVEVQKSNGVVQATSTETGPDGKRALGPSIVFDVIDFLITWKERQARASQLATVHQYNAQIIYDKANGRATEITFSRRGI